jgi:hypothetical protein
VRERDRSRGLAGGESELELALTLGIAGPKKSVAELVSLLIGALGTGTGTSACGGVGTVAVEKARAFGGLWV